MGAKNKKKRKTVDLLEMPDPERYRLIKEVKEQLQQKVAEAKLWQSLINAESLTVNGNIVYRGTEQLNGLHFNNKV